MTEERSAVMPDEPIELCEVDMEQVVGGKVTLSDIPVIKQYDKASPILG